MGKLRGDKPDTRLPDVEERSRWIRLSLENPVVRIALSFLMVVGLFLLLTPEDPTFEIPQEGSIASQDYKAEQQFTAVTARADYTQLAMEAEEEVPSIFRYLSERTQDIQTELHERFDEFRAIQHQNQTSLAALENEHQEKLENLKARRQLIREGPPKEPPKELEESGSTVVVEEIPTALEGVQLTIEQRLAKIDEEKKKLVEELEAQVAEVQRQHGRLLSEAKERFPRRKSNTTLTPSNFQALLEEGFSKAAEDAAIAAIDDSMSGWVVREENMSRLSEGYRHPIRVRLAEDIEPTEWQGQLNYVSVAQARETAQTTLRRVFQKEGDEFKENTRDALLELVSILVEPTLVFDAEATARARARAQAQVPRVQSEVYQRGRVIVREGEEVLKEHVKILQQMVASETKRPTRRAVGGVIAFVLGALFLFALFARAIYGDLFLRKKDVILFCVLSVGQVALLKLTHLLVGGVSIVFDTVPEAAFFFCLPFAIGGMLIRLFLGLAPAIGFVLLQTLFVGILFMDIDIAGYEGAFPHLLTLYMLVSSVAGVFVMVHIRERSTLLRAAGLVAIVNGGMVLTLALLDDAAISFATVHLLSGAVTGGAVIYILLMALIPVLEYSFGFTTDIKLLELANMNQDSLKELAMRAPGTYHHSIMVGNLAESAAESIGANPLLTRVGAYYHDLGKMRNPRYFAENQVGKNPHDKLKPNMSALIVKSHVKDGIEIARNYNLPEDIVGFIPQHHGTALIQFFYARAKELAESTGDVEVDEADFRYPGPKPQRKETALVMLADGVEASARSLHDPNPARLKGLVKKIVTTRFIDGQLDECDLTFRDLHKIVQSFNRVLIGMYHGRPEYPEMPGEQKLPEERTASQALTQEAPPAANPPINEGGPDLS